MSGTDNTADCCKKKHLSDAHPFTGCAFFILIKKRVNLVTLIVRLSGNTPLNSQNLQPFLQPYGYDLRSHLIIGEDWYKTECQHKHLCINTLDAFWKRVMK